MSSEKVKAFEKPKCELKKIFLKIAIDLADEHQLKTSFEEHRLRLLISAYIQTKTNTLFAYH